MKKLVAILLVLTLSICFGTTVFADNDGIALCSSMVLNMGAELKFENGVAKMTADYTGIDGMVEGAHVVFTLQKQGWLWFIWDDVARWVDIELTGTSAARTISYPVDSTGNYKLIVEFTFYNSQGQTEQMTRETEASY